MEKIDAAAFCAAAVKENEVFLKDIPEEYRAEILYIMLRRWGGLRLWDIPEKHFRTEVLYMAAMLLDRRLLWEVPARFRTPELCMVAVEPDVRALKKLLKNAKR